MQHRCEHFEGIEERFVLFLFLVSSPWAYSKRVLGWP